MSKKKANLRDVADFAHVSVATVSRVLNSPKLVSPDTRARVVAAMTELRFTPSAAARAINTGRSRTVAALLPSLHNETFSRFVESLENRLGDFGLSLVVATTQGDPEQELLKARQMVSIGVEAIAVSGVSQNDAFQDYISHTNLPAVGISQFDATSWLPTIGYDNVRTAQLALKHLVSLGHRNIAVVHGPKAYNDRIRARLDGLAQAKAAAKTEINFRLFETDLSLEGGSAAAGRLLQEAGPETAVLALTDVLAMGVISLLHRNSLKVPLDYSVIGMEDLPSSAFFYPPLTTVHLPVRRMGIRVAEALANWLEHEETPDHHPLPIELTIRASTAPPSAKSLQVRGLYPFSVKTD